MLRGHYEKLVVGAMRSTILVSALCTVIAFARADAHGGIIRKFENPSPSTIGSTDEAFGFTVAVMGEKVIIGDPHADAGADRAGAVYVFDGLTAGLLRTIPNPTPAADDFFGYSVDVLGDQILIGAINDDFGGTDVGAAYLFDATSGGMVQTFLNPTPTTNDQFGRRVSTVGGDVLVSAPRDDTGAIDTGAVYLFDAELGTLKDTFENPTPEFTENFGIGLAASGNTVIIGASSAMKGSINTGEVYLFNSLNGDLLKTIMNPTPDVGDDFGSSVAAKDDLVLIGAPTDHIGGEDVGTAYLFDGQTGTLLQTYLNPTPSDGDRFGVSVEFLGDNVVVGDGDDDTGATDAGAAYLFNGSSGQLLQTFLNPTPETSDHFGLAVLAFGDDVLIGAQNDRSGGVEEGAVYLLNAIPEPTTAVLFVSGAILLVGFARGAEFSGNSSRPGHNVGIV